MRILQVSHAVPPDGSTGVENYTILLGRALAARGHDVAVWARGKRADVPGGTQEKVEEPQAGAAGGGGSLMIVRDHLGPGHHHGYDRVRPDAEARFKAFLNDWQPEAVHFHHLLYHSLGFPRLAKNAGAGTVMTLHDFWFSCPAVQRLDFAGRLCLRLPGRGCLPCMWNGRKAALVPRGAVARIARGPLRSFAGHLPGARSLVTTLDDWGRASRECLDDVDVIISPSHFLAQNLQQSGVLVGEMQSRVVVSDYGLPRPLPSGVDEAADAGEQSDRDTVRFGVIGTHRLKGVHVAVEAFRRLASGDGAAAAAGNVPARLRVYGGKVAEMGLTLPANAQDCGAFSAADIERVYGSFDVLIVPSIWYENAPFVIREAFARGRPVIASDLGGMTESVRHEVDGLRFPVGDAGALAECVRRLATEPGLLVHLRRNIRPPKFYDEHLSELESCYRDAVRRRRGDPDGADAVSAPSLAEPSAPKAASFSQF